jgi:hypothetical protein
LAQAILAGEFDVITGHDSMRVQPGDPVMLEIAVIRKLRVDHVSVQVRWSHRPDEGLAPAGRRRLSASGAGHPQFTSPSSGRNPRSGSSHSNADIG